MNCPKCGTLIFDAYTTEQRIKDMYNINTNVGWAKNRLKILIEMLEDHEKNDSLPPINNNFIITDLKKTMNGLETIAEKENKRRK